MKNQELYDISIEEFDKMNEKHVFSEKYKKNKQKMLKDYRKSCLLYTSDAADEL